jgi:hypothetical protein
MSDRTLNVPSGGLTLIVGTQKWVFSCRGQRRPPADIFLNERLPPKTPCEHHVHGRHGHGSPVKKTLKILKLSKRKIYETLTLVHFKKLYLQEHSKRSHWSYSKACFKGHAFCFTTFLVRPSTGAQQTHERAPKNVQMTLKDQSFINKFKVSFVCLPEDL